ncbi:hypothetical protein BG844_07775 [Couchioplanes caeruleus subsp. caeruleus]|uniref:Uncharacterized protein n=1 Tax=Couchioplanes caeruleus subsp. caeruleus TaxID=56427 RepID=A0A1K0GQY5_9ACTN|nr:hypothetical protein BG844_07775 [Couchioplanes caeruleus subsp. caeruleus]
MTVVSMDHGASLITSRPDLGLDAMRSPGLTSIGGEDRRISTMRGSKRCTTGAFGVPDVREM